MFKQPSLFSILLIGLFCLASFTFLHAEASSASTITLTYSGGEHYGSLAHLTFSSNIALSPSDSFQVGLSTANWLFFWPAAQNDMWNEPSRGGALCFAADGTTQYAILTLYGAQSGVTITVARDIPADATFECTLRIFPLAGTPSSYSFNSIAATSSSSTISYSLASTVSIPTPAVPYFTPSSVIFDNKQSSYESTVMGFLDLSTINFTVSGLLPNLAYSIDIWPYDGTVSPNTMNAQYILAAYNAIGVACRLPSGDISEHVRMFLDPTTNYIFVLTDDTPDDTVTCFRPFSANAYNTLQLTASSNATAWAVSNASFIFYYTLNGGLVPNATNSFSFPLGWNNAITTYLDTAIDLESSALITRITTTAKDTTTKIILNSTTFSTAKTGYSLSSFLSASTTRYQLLSSLTSYSSTSSSNTCTWIAIDSSLTSYYCEIPNTAIGQLFSLFISFPLSSLSTPFTHSFDITATITNTTDSDDVLIDTTTVLYYSPALIINSDSRINQTTFTLSEYTFDFLFYAEWPLTSSDTNSDLLQIFDTSSTFDFHIDFYQEPNLETRTTTNENVFPDCILTWNVSSSSTSTATVTKNQRNLPHLDYASRHYYTIQGTNMKIGDVLQLSCTYDIIVTDTNFFPAPVDLINECVVRNKASSMTVAQGYPVQLKWENWWDVLVVGPAVHMGTAVDADFCFGVAGPNTIVDQLSLNAWLTDVLDIFTNATVLNDGTNWFNEKLINGIDNFHWGWALSQYFSKATTDDKYGNIGIANNPFSSPYVISHSSNTAFLFFCLDKSIAPWDSSVTNTLFQAAFDSNPNYALQLTITPSTMVANLQYYIDHSMVYFANDSTFLPVMNLAMGTECTTTPQCQAQDYDYCYQGICQRWMTLPGDYAMYGLQWSQMYSANTPTYGKLPAEYFQFDIMAWENVYGNSSTSSGNSSSNPDNNNDDDSGSGGDEDSSNIAFVGPTISTFLSVVIMTIVVSIMV